VPEEENVDKIPINGLTPMIFRIDTIPSENLPMILGLAENKT